MTSTVYIRPGLCVPFLFYRWNRSLMFLYRWWRWELVQKPSENEQGSWCSTDYFVTANDAAIAMARLAF